MTMKNYRKSRIPPQEYLAECFEYNPFSGQLKWKYRPAEHFKSLRYQRGQHRRMGGKVCGSDQKKGTYVGLSINDKSYSAHCIIYVLVHGSIPDGMMIDHINGNRSDNRLANLRAVSYSGNAENSPSAGNKFGLRGVSSHRDRFSASIMFNSKHTFLGVFETKGLAAVAYAKASIRHHGVHSFYMRKYHARMAA